MLQERDFGQFNVYEAATATLSSIVFPQFARNLHELTQGRSFWSFSLPFISTPIAEASVYDCKPIQGLKVALSNGAIRWLFIGESGHGTNEMPRAFANVICEAVNYQRPVTVAIEFRTLNQPFLDAYLHSDGSPAARAAFLEAPAWDKSWADGKSSLAMLSLIDWLRVRFQKGEIRRVVAFDPDTVNSIADREKGMAEHLRQLQYEPRELAVVLTGSFHARKRSDATRVDSLVPAAALLDPKRTISLRIASTGGYYWGCRADGCGVQQNTDDGYKMARARIRWKNSADYDGLLDLGQQTTVSLPVK